MFALSRRAVVVAGIALLSGAQVALVEAHMSPWMPSMYGVGVDFAYDAGNPVTPIGPGVDNMSDWWFRGPEYRALKPQDGAVTDLPAGGKIDIEIACHVAWTSYGVTPTDPDSELSACPDNYGAYHAGDPAGPLDDSLVSGCALAIADKDDIDAVGWDDLAMFSVNHKCVRQKITTFDIPERMPSCTGDNCVCAWLWLANNGTANFYMTAFDCRITDVDDSLARPILPVIDPVYCDPSNSTCELAVGAKRPLYAYNEPTNVVWEGNDARPGYHASWSFPNDGAQNDIFDLSASPSTTSRATSSSAATTSKRVPHASASPVPFTINSAVERTTTTTTTAGHETAVESSSPPSTAPEPTSSPSSPSSSTRPAPSSSSIDALSTINRSSSSRKTSMRHAAAASVETATSSARTDRSHARAHAARPAIYKQHRHGSKHHHAHFHAHSHPLVDVVDAVNGSLVVSTPDAELADATKLSLHLLERRAPTSGSSRVVGSVAPIAFVLSLALCALL
ncbi:hypothetical protein JCM8208_005785 [Rhodotorula glutinis]